MRVAVVVLNWNGWSDTLACTESLLASDFTDFSIIICDNQSMDDSVDRISQWGLGLTGCGFIALDEAAASMGPIPDGVRVVLIKNHRNYGYAGGNNVGIALAMQSPELEFVWVLNNDTLVAPDALRKVTNRMLSDPTIGLCGSSLVYSWDRTRVQAFGGGCYSKWSGRTWLIGAFSDVGRIPSDPSAVEATMDLVVGAATLVSRRLLNDVGSMCDDYFLYYEEIDWATRAKGRFRLGYASDSLVFHKEGASIGTSASGGSPLSIYYLFRNRIRFSLKHYPLYILTVSACCLLDIGKLILKGRIGLGYAALRGVCGAKWRG